MVQNPRQLHSEEKKKPNKPDQNKTKQNASNLKADYVKAYEKNQYRMRVVRHHDSGISTESGDVTTVMHQSI